MGLPATTLDNEIILSDNSRQSQDQGPRVLCGRMCVPFVGLCGQEIVIDIQCVLNARRKGVLGAHRIVIK